MLVFSRKGIWTKGIGFDTMVASYVLRSEGQHNLDVLAKEHLNYKMVSFDDLTGTGKERKDIRDIPVADVGNYSAEDADITFQLSNILHDKLAAQGMKSLCSDVEFPLIAVLADMEFTGIKIDVAFLSGMSKELERQLDNLVAQIYSDAGEKFNINSTQQLSVILFDKVEIGPRPENKDRFFNRCLGAGSIADRTSNRGKDARIPPTFEVEVDLRRRAAEAYPSRNGPRSYFV